MSLPISRRYQHLRRFLGAAVMAATAAVARGQASPSPARATLPAYRLRILGVFNIQTGEPIEGAEVMDIATHISALTTKTGTVSLFFLPDSGSLVRIQKIGYTPILEVIAISPKDTSPVTVTLTPLATTLPTVVTRDSTPSHISPGLRGFEDRRRVGLGRFLGEAELRKSDTRSFTNVIRSMGVNVQCSMRRGTQCFAVSTRAGSTTCQYLVYRDGLPMTDRNLETMTTDEFGGVESYQTSEIPPQYNMTGSACGVLLLWSRER